MKTTKRIISVLLAAVILIASLTSCFLIDEDPAALIAEAEAALADKSYTVTSVIEYTSEDEKMKDALAAFTTVTSFTEVKGDSFRMSTSFEKDGKENGVIYTYVDGVLYTVLDELGVTTKVSETVTETDRRELAEQLGESASIGVEDFEIATAITVDDTTVITCTAIKDAPLDGLVSALEDQLAALDAHVAIKDAALVITLSDGLYLLTAFACEYVITTDDGVYTLNMSFTSAFEYTDVEEIVAPTF